ncbi:MAG: hypothetical protein VCD50_18475 [Alphaproteobacteria bacterium]
MVVENLAGVPAMDALAGDLGPAFDERWLGVDDLAGFKTKRVSGLMARSPTARDLALHPLALEAAGTRQDLPRPAAKADRLRPARRPPGLDRRRQPAQPAGGRSRGR